MLFLIGVLNFAVQMRAIFSIFCLEMSKNEILNILKNEFLMYENATPHSARFVLYFLEIKEIIFEIFFLYLKSREKNATNEPYSVFIPQKLSSVLSREVFQRIFEKPHFWSF